jgi:D-apiose dehydrogenase
MKQFILFGAGFWAQYQLAAWQEVPGVKCVAICDSVEEKAAQLATRFGIKRIYTSPEDALKSGDIDFVDIVTPPATHSDLVRLVLSHHLPAISQKPVAERLEDAEALLSLGGRVFVHENWRWQTPIRALKLAMDSGEIGDIFRVKLRMTSGFPVFDNQPNLKNLTHFLLADIGVHVLDTARFLCGEAQSVYCHTQHIQPDVLGEDAGTVITKHGNTTVITELGYVQNFYEMDAFPETFALVEGAKGSIALGLNSEIRITTKTGTRAIFAKPISYPWANPAYDVVHSSMVPCLENLLLGVGGGEAETTLADNIQTMRLVEAAYQSAETGEVVRL